MDYSAFNKKTKSLSNRDYSAFGITPQPSKQSKYTPAVLRTSKLTIKPKEKLEIGELTKGYKPPSVGFGTAKYFLPEVAKNIKEMQELISRSGASVALTAIASGVERFGPAIANITPQEAKRLADEVRITKTIDNPVAVKIFGREPLKAIETRIAESELDIKQWGKRMGVKPEAPLMKHALPFAALGVGGVIGLDFTGWGGGRKQVVKMLAKETNILKNIRTLKKMGVADDLLKPYATTISKTGSEKEVLKAINRLEELQKTTKAVPKVPVKPSILKEPIPRVLEPLAEKTKQMTQLEFKKQFNIGLKSQNLTIRDTAQNTLKEIKKIGLDVDSFYVQATKAVKAIKPAIKKLPELPKKPITTKRTPEIDQVNDNLKKYIVNLEKTRTAKPDFELIKEIDDLKGMSKQLDKTKPERWAVEGAKEFVERVAGQTPPIKGLPKLPLLPKIGKQITKEITKKRFTLAQKLEQQAKAEVRGAKTGIAGYKREQRFITSLKDEITRELAKPKARQRSTIAFVKKIGEMNQTVANEIKKEVGLTKPLREANLEELNKVLSKMKERLSFKMKRGFRPEIVDKVSKEAKISDDIYKANRTIKTVGKTSIEKVSEGIREAKRGAEILLTPISTRLKNISPDLKRSLRKFEWNVRIKTQSDLKVADAFLQKIKPRKGLLMKKGMNAGDYADYDLALKNGDISRITALNKKYNVEKEYNAVHKVLDDIYKRADEVGFDFGYTKNYNPRIIKDPEGFLEHFAKREDWSVLDTAIKNKEMNLGRYLNPEEKASLINNLIRGYRGGQITLSKIGAMKGRVIDFIDPTLNKFYSDSSEALVKYIHQSNEAIEARKFFGKSRLVDKKIDQFNNIDDSVGAYVADLLTKGKITVSQEKELASILRARFAPKGASGIVGVYKNLSYIDVMGSPYNAITQIGDMGFSLYSGGIRALAQLPKTIIRKVPIRKEDLGIERIAEEFAGAGTSGRAVDKVFKIIGLDKIDAIGKETLINSTITRMMRQSKKPSSKFMKELTDVFGKETDDILLDLQRGEITENVKYLAFNKLLEFQPVALSEVPEMYLKAGNGRIFYMLKTWTIKMVDVYRNEAFSLMKDKKTFKEGFTNLLKLTGCLMAAEMTADQVKDMILGRETKIEDRAVDSLLKLTTFNRYSVRKAQEQGIGRAFVEKILPPTQFIDNIWRDTGKMMKDSDESFKINEARTIQSIPVFGKLYYWWFGKASTYKKKEKKKTTPAGLPALPKLPKLPSLPKLPKIQ